MDEACNRIFEMVKSKINEPKKKKRTRTYTPKQMEVMKRNLAKGRAVLKAKREAKKSQNVELEVKPIKKESKQEVVSSPTPIVEKSPRVQVKKVVKEVAPPKPNVQPRVETHFEAQPVEEVFYNINFSEGGSLW